MKKVYLAAPFSHKNPDIRKKRVELVNRKAAELMEAGYLVFSPLPHSYPISQYCKVDPCDNEFWLRQDLWIMTLCDEFHILCLEGWEESAGVALEHEEALWLGLNVVLHRN